ncbi:MAG: tRNA preQ1(34) S-adenosylmethionine ribosyltransferase-isomerase QueA [Rhodomicrobium sp.]
MLLQDFDFELPKSSIALRPASPRDSARLLRVNPGASNPLSEAAVRDLPSILRPGDVAVFNDTKVLTAELYGRRPPREAGAREVEVGLTLIERQADGTWKAFARPARRLRVGDVVVCGGNGARSVLSVAAKSEEGKIVVAAEGGDTIEGIMERHGAMPLPPYIARARAADDRDRIDYQTVYAKAIGAVAAPTAGLHFTPELLDRLSARGIRSAFVTLHVGAGTFLPVKTEKIGDHPLHAERYEISEDAARVVNGARAEGGRIVAVGTTSLRVLETAAQPDGALRPSQGSTEIFIRPGHRFRGADLLLTNFHLPKSTLFMLVCAFSGTELMKKAYAHAIAAGFRFYSYGDACLLSRAESSSS